MRLNRRGRRNEMVATGATGRPGANVPRMWKLEAEAQYGTSADVPYIATREALQNARDAIDQAYWNKLIGRKDGRFEVIVDPGPDGPIPGGYNAIRWTDNGIGMDSETFFGKFMVLGDTTKGGEGAGGFGVAKAIILGGSTTFRWRMWTRDRIYVADGFDRPIREYFAPSYRQGVSLTVYDLNPENRSRYTTTGGAKGWDDRLRDFLATNDLRPQLRTGARNVRGRRKEHAGIRMFIGEGSHPLREVAPRLRGKGIPLIEKDEVDTDVWLSVNAYKRKVSGDSGTYAVRLEGLTQFERRMPSETRLDLNVDLATTIAPGARGYPLDKSRNALGDYTGAERALRDLLERLARRAKDRRADDSGKSLDEYEDAQGTLDTQIRVAEAVEAQYAALLSDEDFKARMALAQGGRALLHRWSAKYNEVYARLLRLRRERERALEREREERQRRPRDFYGNVPDIAPEPPEPKRPRRRLKGLEGLDAVQGARKKRVQKPLWPVNPFAPILSVKINRESYTRRRLKRFENNPAKWLRLGVVWRFACEMVLDELDTGADFKVGFIFDADLRAGFSAEGGVYTLWLNPAWFETVLRAYRDRPMNVAAVLHSKACHEIAHMINQDTEGEYSHGRSFAMERETIADETVGVLYPLSVLAAQMLGLKQAPLKRRKRRGKGNRATLAEGDEVVLTRAGLKELAGHLHDTSGLAEIICYRGAGDVEIRFKGKRTKWSTMSPKWVGTGSVKLSAAQREQRAALAVKDKAQRALMRVYKKRGAFDFFDHLRAGAVRIGKGILRHEESGYEVGIERIGKGHASEAFLAADGWVYVFTNEDARDPAKEVLSDAVDRQRTWRGRQPPLLRHLPNIEAVGFGSTARRHGFVWRMPKYSPARGHAGKHGRILAALYRESRGPIHLDFVQRVKAAHKARKIPKALAAAVEELAQRTLDYNGEWAFEFPPRNLMQDDKGNLVLLDVIYDREAVMLRWLR